MKTQSMMLGIALMAMVSVGCSGLKQYEIDAPSDLADKIKEYADEKAAKQSDDYTEIDITTTLVGAEDNSAAWWTEFSQYFNVPSGKKLFVEFENFGSGVNNWNNWNVCVANGKERDTDGYAEYFVVRSDWYGWGNADYNGSVIEFDYGGTEVNWDEFREKMQGAYVTLSVDHARAGAAYLEVHNVATDGFEIVEKYNQTVSATEDINVFIIADGSHFNMKKAYLVPSEIEEIPDFPAVELQLSGTPSTVALGNEDYWGETVATVVFEDGFTTVIPKEELSIIEPDMSSIGTKTVVVTYGKTKLGKTGEAVAAYYNFDVTDFASIEVRKFPVTTTYYVVDEAVPFFSEGLEVVGVKSDGSFSVIDNSALTFGTVAPVAGMQDVEINFSGYTTTCPVTVKTGLEAVGAVDFTNGWWSTFMSSDKPVAAGESVTLHMFVYSDNLANWHAPCTILRKADLSEYAVVRMDNFGWGAGYDGIAVPESDWNWDIFMTSQNMSAVSVTVTNNGDGTADIVYNVTYATGETHFQKYTGIAVDSADLQVGMVTEESYVILLEKAAVDAKLTGIEPVANAYLIGGAGIVTLSSEAVKVNGVYSDGSKMQLEKGEFVYDFETPWLPVVPGTYENVGTVEYTAVTGEEYTAPITLNVKASDQAPQTEMVGAQDFTNGWWSTFSNNWNVPAGTSQTVSMSVGSDNLGNWHSPCVVLRKADLSLGADGEYIVVRQDNYGWGGSYAGALAICDWNWDTFMGAINGSKVAITVANNGVGKASIRYHVIDGNGEEHFQYYDNIAVDSADVTFALVTEESYLVFD